MHRAGTRRRRSHRCAAQVRSLAWFSSDGQARSSPPRRSAAARHALRSCMRSEQPLVQLRRGALILGPDLFPERARALSSGTRPTRRPYPAPLRRHAAQQPGRSGARARRCEPQVAGAHGAPHLRRGGRLGAHLRERAGSQARGLTRGARRQASVRRSTSARGASCRTTRRSTRCVRRAASSGVRRKLRVPVALSRGLRSAAGVANGILGTCCGALSVRHVRVTRASSHGPRRRRAVTRVAWLEAGPAVRRS